MLRYHKLGADETFTTERRARFLRETVYPATRPVGARFARDGDVPVADHLDRPRFLWTKTARTVRVTDASSVIVSSSAPSVDIASAPYTFVVPFAGILRRISCRDVALFDANDNTPNLLENRIRVRYLTVGGVVVSTIMNGTSSDLPPFDIRNYDLAIASGATHMFEVTAMDYAGSPDLTLVYNVRFEFALNITAPGV